MLYQDVVGWRIELVIINSMFSQNVVCRFLVLLVIFGMFFRDVVGWFVVLVSLIGLFFQVAVGRYIVLLISSSCYPRTLLSGPLCRRPSSACCSSASAPGL